MGPLLDALLRVYVTATAGGRRRRVNRLSSAGAAPIAVLFYHRIADEHPNGWTMPRALFERQVEWLRERLEVISLTEARRRLAEGVNRRPAVVLTFDDGYGENCETALPYLLRNEVPFTYFVSTQIVAEQTAFPHDLAAGCRLRPNTVEEIRAMADAGVEIGAHTKTHADLGRLASDEQLRGEIVGSIEAIEQWTGKRPRSFAFPFGLPENLSPRAMAIAHEAGVETVCSAYGAYNRLERVSGTHGGFHVRRVHADAEWGRFLNWMTFDQRKLTLTDPIDDDRYLTHDPQRASDEAAAAGASHG